MDKNELIRRTRQFAVRVFKILEKILNKQRTIINKQVKIYKSIETAKSNM
jgi:hypothetical protein